MRLVEEEVRICVEEDVVVVCIEVECKVFEEEEC